MELYLENKIVNYIKKSNIKMSNDDEDILRYGIQIYYFNISKLIIIFAISFILNVFIETCAAFMLIAILKRYAHGFHADTFWSCLIISLLNIFGIVFLSKLSLSPMLKIILAVFSLFLFILYAPADTEERPLVNPKKRKKLKIQAIIICIVYCLLSLFVNKTLSNMLILSLVFIGFNTSPVLYILFKKGYKNYEKLI